MPYREDLEAALARTAAAEDELAAARSENAHDHERIAEFEKQLAKAPQPAPKGPGRTLWQRLTENGNWIRIAPFGVVRSHGGAVACEDRRAQAHARRGSPANGDAEHRRLARLGGSHQGLRYVHVLFMQGGEREVKEYSSGSGMRIHDPPHCSAVDVWAEAIRRGAPPSALVSIHVGITSDGTAWRFEVGAPGQKSFAMTIPDECPIAR